MNLGWETLLGLCYVDDPDQSIVERRETWRRMHQFERRRARSTVRRAAPTRGARQRAHRARRTTRTSAASGDSGGDGPGEPPPPAPHGRRHSGAAA